tara:strand:+ start:2082 stop:2348 length:267 start_codon:yes stop_codon:yes gene_type:complete
MEGACIYLENNIPKITMYKHINNNKVLYVNYIDKNLNYSIISLKQLTKVLPKSSIHILTQLPYYDSIEYTIQHWRVIILNRLTLLNNK